MTFSKLKTMKEERGFTIVELLIVIIVIAILAAIVIVAYNGVTARANTSKAQTNAVTAQKKAEAYNADNSSSGGNGVYPATATAFAAVPSSALGAVPSGITVQATDPTSSTGTTAVRYVSCSATAGGAATGYYIDYYDFTQSKLVYLTGGSNVTPGANNTTAPTCSNASTT